jgi:hypothetical protein
VQFDRVMRAGFLFLVGGTAVILMFISAGVNDPKPMGDLVVERPLFPQLVAPQSPPVTWLDEPILDGNYSVRLTAAQEAGDTGQGMDIGYGLVLGNDDNYLAVAVSPLGYLSVWQEMAQETETILPWQTWPHVARNVAVNEIWLDMDSTNQLTIRINRELLWQGEIVPVTGKIGVIGESLGETAVVDFQLLEIFSEENERHP